MSVSWYNVVGVWLDMTGIVLIWLFSHKSPGTLSPETIKLSRYVWLIDVGIFLIILGVIIQLLGIFWR